MAAVMAATWRHVLPPQQSEKERVYEGGDHVPSVNVGRRVTPTSPLVALLARILSTAHLYRGSRSN